MTSAAPHRTSVPGSGVVTGAGAGTGKIAPGAGVMVGRGVVKALRLPFTDERKMPSTGGAGVPFLDFAGGATGPQSPCPTVLPRQMVGYVGGNTSSNCCFLIKNGIQTTFTAPPQPFPGAMAFATGINDSDQIVGYTEEVGDQVAEAVALIRQADGSVQMLDSGTGFAAKAINNNGVIVGSQLIPFVSNPSGIVWVGGDTSSYMFPGASSTYLGGVNDQSEVVGGCVGCSVTLFGGKVVPEPPPNFFAP